MSEITNLQELFKSVEDKIIQSADESLRSYIKSIVQSVILNMCESSKKSAYDLLSEFRRYPYYSQVGQDRYLNEFVFKDKKDGFFVEIGAHDGYTISNSYFFEDKRNWKGICVEPIPHEFKKLKEKRKCKCIRAAVSQKKGLVNYLVDNNFSMSSYIYRDNEEDREKIRRGDARLIKVPSLPMSEILKGIRRPIDFISIDTEGSELDVLKSFDIKKYNIKAFVIENVTQQNHLKDYLIPLGYKFVINLGGYDEIFVREDVYNEMYYLIKNFMSN